MLGALAVAVFVMLQPPGISDWILLLPVVGWSSAAHHRLLLVVCFAGAFLAAATWERWRRGELPRWAAPAAALPLGALIAWTYLRHPGSPGPPDPNPMAELLVWSLGVQLAALAAAAGLLAWRPAVVTDGRPESHPGIRRPLVRTLAPAPLLVLLLAVGGELLFFHRPANPPGPAHLFYPATAPIAFLQEQAQEQAGGGRLVAVGAALLPNSAAVLDLADLRASSPMKPWLGARLIQPVTGHPPAGFDYVEGFDHPVLDLLGVRWALGPRGLRLRPPWRRVFSAPAGWVWERPRAFAPLFLPDATEPMPPRPLVSLDVHPDFAAVSLVVERPRTPGLPELAWTGGGPPPRSWRAARPEGSALSGITVTPHRIRARALLAEPRWMASGLYQDGGWRLLADGRRLPTYWVNGPLAGAWLPAGAYALELIYRPPAFLPGMLLAALALAAGAAWWAAPRSCREPHPSSEETLAYRGKGEA